MKFLAKKNIKQHLSSIFRVVFIVSLPAFMIGIFLLGILNGYNLGWNEAVNEYDQIVRNMERVSSREVIIKVTPTPREETPAPTREVTRQSVYLNVDWGGPQLWDAVNDRRVANGVNPLQTRSELCTIASIRLNELLDLGRLDAHEGFSNMTERRPDLEWVFEKYSNVTEFLAYGGKTPVETVDLWQNTLGHSKLVKGGEYVWGCVYAQNSFSVAITAY